MTMTRRDRLMATLKGETVDRPPVSFYEITGFDEDKVRALLEPEGFWERVTGLDQSRLKQLLDDESIAEDIKNRVKSLRQAISSQQRLLVRKRQNDDKNT